MGLIDADGNAQPKKQNKPVCPHCKQEIDEFAQAQVTFGSGMVAILIWCPNSECRALFTVQMGQPPNRVLPVTAIPFNPTRKQ